MNFTKSEIVRLYGSRFFLVEGSGVSGQGSGVSGQESGVRGQESGVGTDRQAVHIEQPEVGTDRQAVPKEQPPVPEQPLTPITWKMRATATVALVMAASEFKNRMMTLALKNCVEEAGVDTSLIGFGVMEDEGTNLDFGEMPVPTAIVFRKIAALSPPEGKNVFSMETVGGIVLDPAKQTTLIALLKEITS